MELNNIATSKDFYRSTTKHFLQEGSDEIQEDYFLTEGLSDSGSVSVNSAFYGDNCDYVYSDWN